MQAKLARLVAPAVCLGYVGYVLVDRFAYHEARKLELIEETRRAKEEAARRVAARPEAPPTPERSAGRRRCSPRCA